VSGLLFGSSAYEHFNPQDSPGKSKVL
jgi:hypothetical protein